MVRRCLLAMMLGVLLGACESITPYQTSGWTGGVTSSLEADGSYTIIARTNGFTPMTAAIDYTYLKAAETMQAAGFTCFEVLSQHNEMERADFASGYSVSTSTYPVSRLRVRPLPGKTDCTENNAPALIAALRPRAQDRRYYDAQRR
jgi:hypothetical protein